jgi:chromosome segregation ATPase
MSARLLFRDSQGRDGEVVLSTTAPTYVGRALDCAIRTDDAMVSRKHSMIRMENGRFMVEDLGSSNGTHINDVRVTKQFLTHNDVVRCGSLWLRYVEDGPLVQPQPPVQAQPTAAKKGGTMRLDANQGAGNARAVDGYAGTMASGPGEAAAAIAAAQNSYQQQAQPQPSPPANQQPAQAYGGPPPMPGDGLGHSATVDPESVVVDMGAGGGASSAQLDELQRRFDDLQARYDREVADGKRLRAETATLRDRIEDTRRALAEKDDVVEAHDRVAEELRAELRGAKDQLAAAKAEQGELADSLAARERQLDRSGEDVGRLKDEVEERDRQIAELSRTKDEGWKKLNEQLGEIEHFREVINEQERMLEERRVGLVSQEEVIKELREQKEQSIVKLAQMKAERDELAADASRNQAKITAIDEENRRLSRMLAEASSGGSSAATDHATDLAREAKELRVEVRTLESECERLEAAARTAENEIDRLQSRVAKLDVDLREAREQREKALSTEAVTKEALARAEIARSKAAEEAVAAAQARDQASTSGEDVRFELDKARRRISELEAAGTADTATDTTAAELERANGELEARIKIADERVRELEAELKTSRAELEAARVDARRGPADEDTETTAVTAVGQAAPAALMDRALEVHDAINDILSELRNNLVLIQGEWETVSKEDESDSTRMISETLDSLMGNAEEAKGELRSLRELVELSSS